MTNKKNDAPRIYNGHVCTARYDLPFDRAFPGSYFFIRSEPSRGIKWSRDPNLYRKAREDEGFYAVSVADPSKSIVLMPEDLVVTVKREKQGAN